MNKVNKEGLTLKEWQIAARMDFGKNGLKGIGAWLRGEDPTEHRAAKEKFEIKSRLKKK